MDAALFWNIINVLGFILSVYALHSASSAQTAARKATRVVLERLGQQEDRDRLNSLLAALRGAKEACIRRQGNGSAYRASGVSLMHDINAIRRAEDLLITGLPLVLDAEFAEKMKNAAGELERILSGITDNGKRDHWKDALATIQVTLPAVEREDRLRREKLLSPEMSP